MSKPTQTELVDRNTVLKLLSDEEVSRVSMAETKSALIDGAEYVDLAHLDQGVQRFTSSASFQKDDIVTRTAVSDQTWSKIISRLTN